MATKSRRRTSNTDKQLAIDAIKKLPEKASWEDIKKEIAMLIAIEEGIQDADAGRVISHDEMKRQVKEWLSK